MSLIFIVTLAAGLVGNPASPPDPNSVLTLPPELIERVESRVMARSGSADGRLDLLASFIFSEDGLGFEYSNDPTASVAETYLRRRGNCLSFTLIFLALAEHAGISAQPREVHIPASWRRSDDALFETGHINVYVKTEIRRAVVDFEPDPILSRRLSWTRRGDLVSRERALAHFYNNRAAELLSEGHSAAARDWSQQAFELDNEFVPALNNRGVIESRLGNTPAAREFFEQALSIEPRNISTLFNLLKLHISEQRQAEAHQIIARLEDIDSREPYFHWSMGHNYEQFGQLQLARSHYQQAIRLEPDDGQFYLALARVSQQLGETSAARSALTQATELGLFPMQEKIKKFQ